MTSTSTLRVWWAPPCVGPLTRVRLHGKGAVSVRSSVVPAVEALNECLVEWDYRTRLEDTGAYNCRPITNGTAYSLHAYGIAIDINWSTNPYGPVLKTDMPLGMIRDIESIRTRSGHFVWRWGGWYSGNKDAMHFEVVCHPDQLDTGIDPSSLPKEKPELDKTERDTLMAINEALNGEGGVLERLTRIEDAQVPEETHKASIRNVRRIGMQVGAKGIEGGVPEYPTYNAPTGTIGK